ncbi:MAG: manganese efflux pump MntP family protein [Clostridia bacterium]|nr:manganese efflux pump MntP family protein [Clostridia bacterium]
MGFYELFLIAVGLSMDAFAVAVCKGLNMPRLNYRQGVVIALFFGVFQAVMPLIGWFLGQQFASSISAFDHWIAFALLSFIGGKMILEALKKDTGDEASARFDLTEILILAIATSIDALAVGITFAFLNVSIGSSVCLIGATTFVLSFIGVLVGHKFGAKYKNKAELFGGVILVLIGVKILLEHLGVIGF